METATVVSLGLGAVGTLAGVTALGFQWREHRRKLKVLTKVVSSGDNDWFLFVEVVNPTLVSLRVRAAGVFWGKAYCSDFPFKDDSGRRYADLPHYKYDDADLEYEATVEPRSSRDSYQYFSDLATDVGRDWGSPVELRPFCRDTLGKQYWGRPVYLDHDEEFIFPAKRRRLPPWGWRPERFD